MILLAAPTSTDARLARIAAAASGFIYCVSTTGVTGARAALRTDLPEFVARRPAPHRPASGRRVRRVHRRAGGSGGRLRRRGDHRERAGGHGGGSSESVETALPGCGRSKDAARRCGRGGRQRGSVSDEDALFLQVVLERLRAHAVEPGEIGEIVLADGEQLRDGIVAQLAQEGQVGLQRPPLFGVSRSRMSRRMRRGVPLR